MTNHSNNHFLKYRDLRKEIDSVAMNLEKEHSSHMKCKAGCDLCCMDYGILPVEFFSILNELKVGTFQKELLKESPESESSCIFLQNHICTIYKSRPVICRTHGLPLLFTNEDGEWQLSACELNFTQFNFEKFNTENTYQQDKYNSKLFLLNRDFIAEFKEKKFEEFELIPLKKLIEYL
jgi:Fe-S-cluster containining protein